MAYANDTIQNLLPGFPLGSVAFRDIPFELGDGTKVSTECKSYPTWPSQVTVPLNGTFNVQRVHFLANAGYTRGFSGRNVGVVELLFDQATVFTYDLVIGATIRDWRTGDATAIGTLTSADTVSVYAGRTRAGDTGEIDMITIEIPSQLQGLPLTAITVRDTMPGDACLFFIGLTLSTR